MSENYWPVIEDIWDDVDIYEGPVVFLKDFNKLTGKQKTLLATHWAESEIMNGGLGQFFDNSTGVLAPEAVAGFNALGMPETAKILQKAMAFFGHDYPRERAKRIQVFEAFYVEHGEEAIPMESEEDAMAVAIETENKGFDDAACEYAIKGE